MKKEILISEDKYESRCAILENGLKALPASMNYKEVKQKTILPNLLLINPCNRENNWTK